MGSNTAIPGGIDTGHVIRTSAQAAGQEFARGQFAVRATGADLGKAKKGVANESGDVLGITAEDERSAKVKIAYPRIVKVPLDADSTPKLDEVAYLSGVSEVTGDDVAGAGATGIGYFLRIETGYAVVRTRWYYDLAPAAGLA